MSHKSPKIEALIADIPDDGLHARHYLGFFKCFNAQFYYEAHDVLEELWLPLRGTPQARFYQGLIQVAGGFVHLQKNRIAPARAAVRAGAGEFRDVSGASCGDRPGGGAPVVPGAAAGDPGLRRDGESVVAAAAAATRVAERGGFWNLGVEFQQEDMKEMKGNEFLMELRRRTELTG